MNDQTPLTDYQKIINQKDREIRQLQRQLRTRIETEARISKLSAAKKSVDNLILLERKRQEKYMQLLLNNSPDMILLLDQTGRVSYCTKSFLTNVKIPNFEMINGHHYESILATYGLDGWLEHFAPLFVENPRSSTFPVHTQTGNQYQVHFAPTFNEEGQTEGFIVIIHDITDLFNAKKQAEEANVSKTNFLSNMSHEIRTPINAIIGMSHIAKDSKDLTKLLYCIDQIDTASTHLLGIINDILDMSKIESGKFEVSPMLFNWEEMVMKISSVQVFRMDEKHQEFFVALAPNIPRLIVSDEQRLTQVITNLLSNAIKFTPEHGKIALKIEKKDETENAIQLQISIIDTGIGISNEKLQKLFHPFEQGDSGVARKFGGTGLGLVISKNIINLLGGEISVDSKAGEGSTFAFTMWADKCNDSELLTIKEITDIGLGDLRLLVVGGSYNTLGYFEKISESIPYNHNIMCHTTNGGTEAIELLKNTKDPYHIAFINYAIPDMNSLELVEYIKKNHGSTAIVAMTSFNDHENIKSKAYAAGVSYSLPTKPLFASNLIDCINTSLYDLYLLPDEHTNEKEKNTTKDIFKGKHLLLVEDIEINREIAIALLEETGIDIKCAEDGAIACSCFSSTPDDFDIILMDVQMPVVDGLEATRRIRAMGTAKAKEIPIVAMTANVFKEDIDRCIESGMNAHVGKPFDIDILISILKQYLL